MSVINRTLKALDSRSTLVYTSSVAQMWPRVRQHRGRGINRKHRMTQEQGSTPYGYCECGCGQLTRASHKTERRWGHVKGVPRRFITGHNTRLRVTGPEYLEEDRGYATSCWIWQRGHSSKGYGVFKRDGENLAHRVYYKREHGHIPKGLDLDHLCRVPACVNPNHLEAVTPRVNVLRGISIPAMHARQTHCIRGHELAGANLYVRPDGGRTCRTCVNAGRRVRLAALRIDNPVDRRRVKVDTTDLIAEYENGASLAQVGEAFGMTAQGVFYRFQAAGYKGARRAQCD